MLGMSFRDLGNSQRSYLSSCSLMGTKLKLFGYNQWGKHSGTAFIPMNCAQDRTSLRVKKKQFLCVCVREGHNDNLSNKTALHDKKRLCSNKCKEGLKH